MQIKDRIYYGQLNDSFEFHGIGTLLHDNGFIYQGMFEHGMMNGLGFSHDANYNKYLGEHKEGQRHGYGIQLLDDGRQYKGSWSENRLHGICKETLSNGQSYLVYFDGGRRKENLAIDHECKLESRRERLPVPLEMTTGNLAGGSTFGSGTLTNQRSPTINNKRAAFLASHKMANVSLARPEKC